MTSDDEREQAQQRRESRAGARPSGASRGRRGPRQPHTLPTGALRPSAGSSSKKSNSMSSSRGSMRAPNLPVDAGRRKEFSRREVDAQGVFTGARDATSSSAATARCGRSAPAAWARSGLHATSETGLDVALKIVAREGKAGRTRRARGPRRGRAAPSALPAHLRARPRRGPCLHRLRVHPGPHAAPGAARRRARRPRRASRSPRRCSRRSRTPTAAASSTATSSRRTSCSPSRTEIDVRLLDFGLAQMAEFDTLTAIGDVPGRSATSRPSGCTASRRPPRRTSGPSA